MDDGIATALGDGCAGWSAWLRTTDSRWPGSGELRDVAGVCQRHVTKRLAGGMRYA